eukprot:jgi/Ulvmu1/6527/UM003_0160.1
MDTLLASSRGSITPCVRTSAIMKSRPNQLTLTYPPLPPPPSSLHRHPAPSPGNTSDPGPSDGLHSPPPPAPPLAEPLAALPISAALIAAAASAVLAIQAEPALAESLSGAPRVVDGDTLEFGSERVRLYGVDAPESKQLCKDRIGKEFPCGVVAKDDLVKKIGSRAVTCDVRNKDMYGRSVSVCYVDGGIGRGREDLNAWLVSQGDAVAYEQYSKDYVPMERQAKAEGKGIWAGEFQNPAQWRKENPRGGNVQYVSAGGGVRLSTAPSTTPPDSRCPVKGNISSSGEKIFHVPGGRYYESTVIDVGSGERWFCSATEAEKAGWRASRM